MSFSASLSNLFNGERRTPSFVNPQTSVRPSLDLQSQYLINFVRRNCSYLELNGGYQENVWILANWPAATNARGDDKAKWWTNEETNDTKPLLNQSFGQSQHTITYNLTFSKFDFKFSTNFLLKFSLQLISINPDFSIISIILFLDRASFWIVLLEQ